MIDIVIPSYNEEKYIGGILSILKNKLTLPHTVIVSDDKSTDGTVNIAKQYADLVLEPLSKHNTIGANRNSGAAQGSGDIIVFFDADVVIKDPDEFFNHALKRFEKEKNLAALTGQLRVVKDLETISDRVIYFIFNFVHLIKNNIFHTGEASGKFQMMRRKDFEKIGGYNESLVSREDADIFQRLAKECGRTAYDGSLIVGHSGRRSRAYGWPKLLYIWMRDAFTFAWFKKPTSKEWQAVR
ncbi:MAG: putative glycosyltransferase [Candidatus Taylorbacteria bacterium]|nr:putative glycosyltransferase [Candidatus Taylorbacteria bacterium]